MGHPMRRGALSVIATAIGVSGVIIPAAAATAAPIAPHGLLITELAPDHVGSDHFEFIEVTNTSDAPIDLADEATFSYVNGGSATALTVDPVSPDDPAPTDPTVLPAGETAVLWLSYTSSTVDSFVRTAQDFRDHWAAVPDSAADAYRLLRITGQAGMANGGDRAIQVVDESAAVVSTSYYPGGSVSSTTTAQFGVPASGTDARLIDTLVAPSPGYVAPEQLESDDPVDPGPTVPEQPTPPPTDPELAAPTLQITELAPDTANLDGADAYEFVEVYNASDAPVAFEDFTVNYLYADGSLTTTNSTLWPATPPDSVIEPGQTLVLWIRNGRNDALTADDFNAHFGSRLIGGENLVDIFAGGMANGGPRGIQVMTNTGHDVSRAYYESDDQTVADQPIQYAWSGTADPVQQFQGPATATPGYTDPAQVPGGLVATPDDTQAPVIEDLTGSTNLPDTPGLALGFDITDNRQVRTVELTIDNDVDEPVTKLLRFGAPDQYLYSIPEVDLYGKRWVEYSVRATDGTNESLLDPMRVSLVEGEPAPLRLDVTEGQYVSGTTRVTATTAGAADSLGIAIAGSPASPTTPALEGKPYFAFEATSTDAFFRNGVKLDDEVLAIFDQGFYERIETVAAPVPADAVVRGDSLTVGIYAGTKAFPEPSVENNDDFSALNLRLALPDGRVLRPTACAVAGEAPGAEEAPTACPTDPEERIGFNDAAAVYFKATFEIPDDAFDSIAYRWDTTQVADGPVTVTATDTDGSVDREVIVDNTAPVVAATGLGEQRPVRGEFTIGAEASDPGAGVTADGVAATLDGEEIELPYATSSVDLAPGDHQLLLTARDRVGNETVETVSFTTADERPTTTLTSPESGATLPADAVELTAEASSPEGDELTMRFLEGSSHLPTDESVQASSGTIEDGRGTDRGEAQALTPAQLEDIAGVDGITHEVSSETTLPYQLFTVDVPSDAGDDARVRVRWTGSANADAKVLMYVLDTGGESWTEVDRHVTAGGTDIALEALVPAADHVRDGEVTIVVQHSEGFAAEPQTTRQSDVAPFHPGATPRSAYDFTIGWESDTQYYNETDDFYRHQVAINEFFVDQREELNLQYVIHTGDIVNVAEEERQWLNADPVYRLFDDADLPYGVLAGNHDVGHHDNDYTHFSQWFGEARFADNPWYGESHLDNRGHYDLISANGVDFLMLYMGWAPGDEQIEWMNDVIARYPERKVWVNLHEFMLTSGGLGPIPQRIMDEVVATNPNVFAVSSGHYHDAFTRTDEFDDDGDGNPDRTVYSMLFDYQGLEEGGLGYLRLAHFDNAGERILFRTYSPSLEDFDAEDPSLEQIHQGFEIPYAAVGISPRTKTLATDAFTADVLTSREIGVVEGVASGSSQTVPWEGLEPGEHGWYVETSGPFGGVDISEVRTLTVDGDDVEPGRPRMVGRARVGEVMRVDLGAWPEGSSPEVQWLIDGRPISGATRPKLSMHPRFAGKRLAVEATGTVDGEPVTLRSGTRKVQSGKLSGGKPKVKGPAVVGRTLKAKPGRWQPKGVKLSYRWVANGKTIRGADGKRLELTRKLAGKRIKLVVKASRYGYQSKTVRSAKTAKVRR